MTRPRATLSRRLRRERLRRRDYPFLTGSRAPVVLRRMDIDTPFVANPGSLASPLSPVAKTVIRTLGQEVVF